MITSDCERFYRLNVKTEVHDIPILHDILLAFYPHLAGIFRALLALVFHEIVIGDHLGADEAALEIVVNHGGSLGGGIALVVGSGGAFLFSPPAGGFLGDPA